MTLARTALRLCTTAALKGAADARPTIAQNRVYDSRMDDLNPENYVADAKAAVIVFTDADEGDALSRQNGGSPFRRMIDLVIEIGMVQALAQEGDGGPAYIVGYPDTDKRLEASLDYLEFQIVRRLSYDPAPLSVLFRSFARIVKYACHRQVLNDAGVKVAARILTLTCDTKDDQVVVYNQAQTASLPTGLEVLPEPLLRVAKAMPDGSSEADVCMALAAALAPLSTPPLGGFDPTYAAGNPVDPGAPTVEATIDLPQS
ncbi:hypothetical protein JQ633_12575 [Bradyrhizobium tropiciagri]|uniref:hypothetical protein n=1 Tax=Bradyrhizobium tropiciagri TaxID=312253 RepID=UPI001BAA8C45|nr:hypothetical protein [Bradyrhizobium tropiciagri]MBR0871198.1 hypothetical protein [Bradyrhizobium tropiciagri]